MSIDDLLSGKWHTQMHVYGAHYSLVLWLGPSQYNYILGQWIQAQGDLRDDAQNALVPDEQFCQVQSCSGFAVMIATQRHRIG